MSRWGSTGVFDSSQLTAVKQTRNVYANALAQRTAVDKAGKPFMRIQSASAGEGGPVNGFSIASDTGALNLTQAEFDAIVAQETPGPSGPPPFIFTYDGSGGIQLDISAIPVGYTSLAYILCGGGGGGGGYIAGVSTGAGGGSGGYRTGTLTVSAGKSISISFGSGGLGGEGAVPPDPTQRGNDGSGTILTYDGTTYTAGGGGGGTQLGGTAGIPVGSAGVDGNAGSNNGKGGTGGGGGGGGGGGSPPIATPPFPYGIKGIGSNGASDGGDGYEAGAGGKGGDGYYRLILT